MDTKKLEAIVTQMKAEVDAAGKRGAVIDNMVLFLKYLPQIVNFFVDLWQNGPRGVRGAKVGCEDHVAKMMDAGHQALQVACACFSCAQEMCVES